VNLDAGRVKTILESNIFSDLVRVDYYSIGHKRWNVNINYFKKNWDYLLIISITIILIMWLIYGEHGICYLKGRSVDFYKRAEAVEKLWQEKNRLEEEVYRMKTDREFIEKYIKENSYKLRENEIKIVFEQES
jgi:cell division protein FtsB